MSDRSSAGCPLACSGDIYAMVPTSAPWIVAPVISALRDQLFTAVPVFPSIGDTADRAIPKSMMRRSFPSIMMLAGLRSLWITPA